MFIKRLLSGVLGMVLLVTAAIGRGQVLALDTAIQGQPLGAYLQYWVDDAGDSTFADVLQKAAWLQVSADIPNFGRDNRVYWFRLDIQAANLMEPWLLQIPYILIDDLRYYLIDENNIPLVVEHTGMEVPGNLKGNHHRTFLFSLTDRDSFSAVVYMRAKSEFALHMPLYVWPSSALAVEDEKANILLGIYFGTLGIMALYNFFMFTLSRKKMYIIYSVLLLFTLTLHAEMRGVGVGYFFPSLANWDSSVFLLSSVIVSYLLALHAEHFLHLGTTRFPFKKAFAHLRWLCLVAGLVLSWKPSFDGVFLMILLVSATAGMTFFAILYCYRPGDRPLSLYALAWFLFLVGILSYGACKGAILPYDWYSEHIITVGSWIGALAISIAMGDRNYLRLQERLALVSGKNALLQNQIEKQVSGWTERISEREQSQRILLAANEQNDRLDVDVAMLDSEIVRLSNLLEQDAKLDKQSNCFNRHYFNDQLNREWNALKEGDALVGVLMVKVAGMDKWLQQQGYLQGQKLIESLAAIISASLHESTHTLARFDKDIFAVIFPDTTEESMREMVKKLQQLMGLELDKLKDRIPHAYLTIHYYCQAPSTFLSQEIFLRNCLRGLKQEPVSVSGREMNVRGNL